MYKFSERSLMRLSKAHDDLQLIAKHAINYTDFTIVTGHRGEKEQNDLYERGFSKLRFPQSKHNSYPSRAIDVAPYVRPYGVIFGGPEQIRRIMGDSGKNKAEVISFVEKSYARLIGILEGIAHENGIRLRVGLDWDHDFDTLDQTFHDLGHIELK